MKAKRKASEFTVSNPDKVLYPAGRFTKANVVDYYVRVAPFLLPHFRDPPVTLKRYPDGVYGEAFYEKDAPAFTPDRVKTFPVPRREGGPDINYILINDVATLAWCANVSALELHPLLHRAPRIGYRLMSYSTWIREKALICAIASRLLSSCVRCCGHCG